jgi:hypothetical protein
MKHIIVVCAIFMPYTWCMAADSTEAAVGETAEAALLETYVKRGSWLETMLASRQAELHRIRVAGEKPIVVGQVSAEVPGRKISVSVAGCQRMRLVSILSPGKKGDCFVWGDASLIAKDGTRTQLSHVRPAATRATDRISCKHSTDEGSSFKHGVWLQGSSDIRYELKGEYERFEASVELNAGDAAEFKVLLAEPNTGLWERISADFPLESKWFEEDNAGGYHA